MDRVAKLFGQLKEHSNLSATVTVIAMLIAGVLATLDDASWGLYVIVALCVVHVVLAIRRLGTRPGPEPGQ
jgi:hypothetical protein